MSLENPYSTKTLMGNWQEERQLFGNKYNPAISNKQPTTYNLMHSSLKLPAKEFKNLKTAGFSRNSFNEGVNGVKFNGVEKGWSSLGLENKGPRSDNRFLSTVRQNYWIFGGSFGQLEGYIFFS